MKTRRVIIGLFLAALVAAGCDQRRSTTNISGSFYCSVIVTGLNGQPQTISGSPGESVTFGNTVYTFNADCSTTTTATTTGGTATE